MDGSTFVLHKLCALAIRLNELYIIFRKIGRKVYFSNFEHLYDTKLHFQLKNQNYFKLHLLKDMDEMFNSTRKNGTLLATLTRFFRQGAIYEVNAKNVLDFTNFINQGHMMLLGCLTKQEEFSFNWLATELRFRKVYGLPKKILTEVYTEVSEKNLPQKKVVNSSTVSNSTPVKAITTDLNLLTVDGGSRTLSRSSSRSSSINSQTSIPIVTPMKSIARRVNRNSMIIPSSLPTPNGNSPSRTNSITSPTRPQSMIFMNNNHSLTSLPLQKTSTLQQKLAAVDTVIPPNNTMAGRRRSNSQPIKPLENLALPVPISAAASGAASALKGSPAVNRSPSGSIKRSGSVSRSSPQPKPLIVVEEETVSKPAQLTANQRLQQHLKQAAKQGALMTQQRETFTSVLFDPNSPSSVNLRPPKSPNASEQSPQSSESLQSPQSLKTQGLQPPNITTSFTPPQSPSLTPSPVPKTRDQVTRMNTRRNSIHQNIPSTTSSLTSFSSESSSKNYIATVPNDSLEASSIPKRVRFTGVPEYSPAEDAPTSYSSRILKNFAVFKTPSPNVYKPGFKKKDQMLKKEESISFKTQLHNPTLDNSPTSTGGFQIPPANANPISTNRLSKLKSKLI